MDLGEQAHQIKFMIRDRGSNFTAEFDAVLADTGIHTVLCSIRAPRMNAIAETLDRGMPPRAPGPHPYLEPGPSTADPARVRDPPQSAPAAPLPARRRATQTATRTGRSRPLPRPTTDSRRWPDRRISPGRMTWTRFSARTRRTGNRCLKAEGCGQFRGVLARRRRGRGYRRRFADLWTPGPRRWRVMIAGGTCASLRRDALARLRDAQQPRPPRLAADLSFRLLSHVVVGCRMVVLRPWRAAGSGLAGFRRTGQAGQGGR
jgi:hypothetical protein